VNVIVQITKNFKNTAKPLLKKYPSLQKDLLRLEAELINNPTLGTSLGHNAYKIRLKISSKGKGKSGGARVISLVQTILINKITTIEDQVTVSLITIYDKADTATISDKELREMIKSFHKDQ
jgi:mRNA-degrading endonuclease RelE of RelBE toxin-antitoxin system